MERNAELTQTTELEDNHTSHWFRLMRHFFTGDVSPDNHPLVEMQRRAVWIGLALILQSFNEIPPQLYTNLPRMYSSPIFFVLFLINLGSFAALIMAFRPTTLKQQAQDVQERPRRWQRLVLVLTILLTLGGVAEGVLCVRSFFLPRFTNDGTSIDINAAALLVQGKNPYSDSNILDIMRKFPVDPDWTTPLEQGQFANHPTYPTVPEVQSVLDTDLKAGTAPEFESKVSYPTLSFLTLVPFALFHDYNVLPFYLLSYLLIVYVAWRVVRPEMRPWVVLLAIANVPMLASTAGGNLDIFTTLLLILAWLWRDKRWASAIMLGLAFATKQPAWFFLPFYLILTMRSYGLKETVYRSLLAGTIALACNLPFIIWNPHAWIAGVLAPVSDPMYPQGVGIVGLNTSQVLPFMPKFAYTMLEVAAMAGTYLWYWRICRQHPESVMLLAVLPLFLAWRSLSSYFYCAAFPLFILQAARTHAYKQNLQVAKPLHLRLFPLARNEHTIALHGYPAD